MAKILVVEDAVFVRNWCSRLLRENGYDVVEAANGDEALEIYRNEKPDGVLLDITAPETDGVVTIQEIMKMDPAARVAMVTAMGQNAVVLTAIEAGARDSVMKPFDSNRVLDAVEKLIG
ncbi:MAG TPA: response regulator [Dehalococcoidales bacterium]|nr:response regulator [Dehalococcoidales bacterium]